MFKKTRKRMTVALAVVTCLALLVGSFAFFTDRLTADATATAGNINLVWEDTSLKTNSNNQFAQDKAWDNALVSEGNVINPGDYFDLSYTLTNDGSKSIDVRQQIVLVSDVPMTENAEEYKLTITGGNDSVAVVPAVEQLAEGQGTKLTYNLADIILVGSLENDLNVKEQGAVSGAYTVRLDFAKAAKNAFMDSIVTVDLYAAAKQHRNTVESDFPAFELMAGISTNADWEAIAD